MNECVKVQMCECASVSVQMCESVCCECVSVQVCVRECEWAKGQTVEKNLLLK